MNKLPSYNTSLATLLALISALVVFVDATIVNLALPSIEMSMHATRAELEWVLNAYTLSFASVMLGSGALADKFGPRRIFIWGLTIFLISSGTCALSSVIDVLIGSRFIQGAGAALILPSSLKLALGASRTDADQQRTIGLWAAAGGAGLAIGHFLAALWLAFFHGLPYFG